jgi:hypothetical protein
MKITDMRTPKLGSVEYEGWMNGTVYISSPLEDQSLIEITDDLNNLLTDFGDEDMSSGDRKRLEKSLSQIDDAIRYIYSRLAHSNRSVA